MPKKLFDYKLFEGCTDIWYTDSLIGWYIVKDADKYHLYRGKINSDKNLCLLGKSVKQYLRLGDAKTGLENYCKERIQRNQQQDKLYKELTAGKEKVKASCTYLDYAKLDQEVLRLKQKWGLR